MSGVRLSRRARADLISIWRYSARTWSSKQADSYLAFLEARISQAAANPRLFRLRPDVGQSNIYAVRARSHVVFATPEEDGGWMIVAVLHGHMDAAAQLQKDEDRD